MRRRNIYYQDQWLFGSQAVVDNLVDDLAFTLLVPVLVPGRDDICGGIVDRMKLVQLGLDDAGPGILIHDLRTVLAEKQNLMSLEDPARNPSSAVVLLGQGKITGEWEC